MDTNKWIIPHTKYPHSKLIIFNSLTKGKVEFIPEYSDSIVRWYSCGPTVYDSAHMGHAR